MDAKPTPWHLRLQARLAAVENAAAALQAVCAEPDAHDALEVRGFRCVRACERRRLGVRASLRLGAHPSLTQRPRGPAQARDLGFASAVAAAHMNAAAARQRLNLAAVKVQSAQDTLTCFRGATSGAVDLGTCIAHLPPVVVLRILLFLPADARARAMLVCCAWRDSLAHPAAWAVLDLSPESGVRQPVTEDVLRGAAARARGQLVELNVDGCELRMSYALKEVVSANRSLLKLSAVDGESFLPIVSVSSLAEEFATAGPQLVSFRTSAGVGSLAEAARILRGEAPFGILQPIDFSVVSCDREGDATVLAFCSAMSTAQTPMHQLCLRQVPLDVPGAYDTFFSASILRQVRGLRLIKCRLTPESLSALASVIRGGVLEYLDIDNHNRQLFDESTCGPVADAVAKSRTLTELVLFAVLLWEDEAAATAVLRALTGHPTLTSLSISYNRTRAGQDTAGAALGRLIAANSPALKELKCDSSNLRDAGLRPLFEALPHNAHLRSLDITNNNVSHRFASEVVLPAVEANTSLRELKAHGYHFLQDIHELDTAARLVAARNEEV
jgi:hypothetical protein